MSRLAGQRPPRNGPDGMTIDYADVLAQAVDNERWRVLREVRAAVARIDTLDHKSGASYSRPQRPGDAVKREALAAIDAIGDRP